MRKLKAILIAATLILGVSLSPLAEAKGWEPVKNEKVTGQHVVGDSEIEIKTGNGIIYVNTSKHVNIKIFTILGSRISEDNLSPGFYQFAVPTHGVFIVKAGELTCKVAL